MFTKLPLLRSGICKFTTAQRFNGKILPKDASGRAKSHIRREIRTTKNVKISAMAVSLLLGSFYSTGGLALKPQEIVNLC
ncbi:hypothetical protein [Lyngbya aestuarii]|uniref:hypothetical protein n=1 Tax=Lyngbya aestuarii TaxID=118322 RepID=UPI00403D8E70